MNTFSQPEVSVICRNATKQQEKNAHPFSMLTQIRQHIYGHKIRPNKIQRIEIMQNKFFYHNIIKIKINTKSVPGNSISVWEIKQQKSKWPMGQRRNHKGN